MSITFNLIDAALYLELYLICSVVLLLKSGIRLSSAAFIFFSFYTLQLGIGPVVEVLLDRGVPSRVSPYIDILLPFAIFVIGYCCSSCLRMPRRFGKKSANRRRIEVKTEILCWAYIVCLAAGIAYLLKTGLNPFSSTFNNDRIASQSGMGAFLYLNGALVVIIPLMFEHVLNKKLDKKVFIFALLCALAVFILRGSRGLCMTPLFLMLMLLDVRKPIRAIRVIQFAAICLIAVSIMGALRSGGGATYLNSFINTTCDHIENLNRVYGVFKFSDNLQYGATFFFNYNLVLPGEGQDYTLWLKDLVGATFSGGGMTPSIIGDFYINFGYPGVYLGMFALGVILYKLEVAARSSILNRVFFVYLCWECATVVGGGISNGMLVLTTNTLMYLGLKFISERQAFSKERNTHKNVAADETEFQRALQINSHGRQSESWN